MTMSKFSWVVEQDGSKYFFVIAINSIQIDYDFTLLMLVSQEASQCKCVSNSKALLSILDDLYGTINSFAYC